MDSGKAIAASCLPTDVILGHRVTDLHVHIQPWEHLRPSARAAMADTREPEEATRIARFQKDAAALVAQMDAWGVDRMALINYVSPEVIGFDASVNEWVLRYCRPHRERLLPVGSVHPRLHRGTGEAYREVQRLADAGMAMLKLHPAHQLLYPDAYRADSRGARGHPPDDRPYGDALRGLYEACSDFGVPLMVHTGTSIFPGALNAGCDPLLLDAVATDFPRLRLVLAHAGRPLWGEAASFVARRHANVWLDLSGIPPERLAHYVPDLPRLASKCVWGTDWPGPGLPADAPRGNVERFLRADLPLDAEARRLILEGNSRRLLP